MPNNVGTVTEKRELVEITITQRWGTQRRSTRCGCIYFWNRSPSLVSCIQVPRLDRLHALKPH